ncbi:LemA family protein [Paenibacillus sp. IB182496]|uniref:LemA family protein n=1 Tax=Paenibacillus sabuli TaxID=2772509 RepID=A0A927BTS1_9BACL|nr:LemA family protein [Paenibacillus sabuli]MBD2845530.1 LemA family protein [Paenibacillus sabuli]
MVLAGIIVVCIIALYVIVKYNSLVGMRNRIKEAHGAIEVYLQQRFDALLKVAQAVVEYARYEADTLKEITALRAGADQQSAEAKLSAMEGLNQKLSAIVARAEDYPELNAGENYLHLQRTANDLEEKLSASRRTYNANVVAYNTAIASVPTNLFAGMLGFREQGLYEVEEAKKADVNLSELLQR